MNQTYNLIPIDFDPFKEEKEIYKTVLTSEAQKEIWLSCILGKEESNLAYNESVSLDFKGTFNQNFFIEAFQELVLRHEALRSSITADGETLIIYKDVFFEIYTEDFTTFSNQKEKLNEAISKEMHRSFNLQQEPLFRAYLHKLGDDHHYFTIILHHIIADGWSIGEILDDLSKIYNSKIKGIPLPVKKIPQISEYAQEMFDFEKSEDYNKTLSYWLDLYRDTIPVLDLPTDFPRPGTRTYQSSRVDQTIPIELINQLKTIGVKSGCSLVNILLNAFEVFIYQQTNQNDIVVGLPSAGQLATEKLGLVGHCVNLLPLRTFVDDEISFTDYLKKRKSDLFDAFEHQKFTFGQLVKKLRIKRDPSRIPLVSVVFNIDMGMDSGVSFEELDYTLNSNARASETFEISLNLTASKENFVFEWSYNKQLFKLKTIEKMASDFESLLKTICSNPKLLIKELSKKESNSWRNQLEKWNNTSFAYDKNVNLTQLIDVNKNKFKYKTAISFNGQIITYEELGRITDKFANYLLSTGIKKGDIIGLAIDRSIEMVISLLAIMKAGATYLPLDPEFPKDRIEYMLFDSRAKLLITSESNQGKFKSDATELVIEKIWAELKSTNNTVPAVHIKDTDLAYILYTSGSTGKPKGVQIMHYNLVNFLLSMQHKPGIKDRDKLLAITTISFDIAGLELFLPLIAGAELVICDKEMSKDGRYLLDIIENQKITILQATPATWRMMLESGWKRAYKLKALCGGEPLSHDLAHELLTKCSSLWNMYGPTETTIWSTIKEIKHGDSITIGYPIRNTRIYILSPNNEWLSPGNIGEICIGGDGLAEGYHNQPALTAERFIKNPFSNAPQSRIYRTGDLGKLLENGEIVCLGRIDQQVKIRGYRIELGEIESELAAIDEISQVVVVAAENLQSLIAYVVLTNERKIESNDEVRFLLRTKSEQWKKWLKTKLPDYMIPQEYIILKSLPLTPNHKIDRKALPKPKHSNTLTGLPKYKNVNEQLIANIWCDLLNKDSIDPKDDFFELGGHSLLAVRVMVSIEEKTGKRLPLATLFENPTIEKLAKMLVADEEAIKWNSLVPIKKTGSKTPVYMIHGGGLNVLVFSPLGKYMNKDQPVYGMQALGLDGKTEFRYNMEELADLYNAEILNNDPVGPYSLVGYSFGGLLAFEMAKKLIAAGKKVKMLGILDSYADGKDKNQTKLYKIYKKITRQFRKVLFFGKMFINNPGETYRYQVYVLKLKIANLFNTDPTIQDEAMGYLEEIELAYDTASQNYSMEPLDIKVDLFRVKKRIYFLDDPNYLGWKKYAKKGVNVHEVPGDHKTFLFPPYDKEFAEVLQRVLDSKP